MQKFRQRRGPPGKALNTCLLHYAPSTTADCSGVGRFSIMGGGGGEGGQTLVSTGLLGGHEGHNAFQNYGGGVWLAPAALPPVPTPMDCIV